MRLLFIRHGETDANLALALDTAYPGTPLNETGHAQADALAEQLENLTITAVVTSDLTRAVETGAPLARHHGLTPVATPDLRELQAGDLEMTTDAESFQQFEAVAVQWFRGDLDARMPGGETGTETLTRLDRGIGLAERNAGPDGCAAVIAHGAAIRLWVTLRASGAEGMPPLLRNTGVVDLAGSAPSGWTVRAVDPDLTRAQVR